VLSLNSIKDTYNDPYMTNSESSLFSMASNYNRQKPLSKTELIERYKHIINRSVEFIFALSMSNNINIIIKCLFKIIIILFLDEQFNDKVSPEVAFACHLFTILLYNLTSIIQNTREQRQQPWVSIYGAARDIIRYKNYFCLYLHF
jgi:hypothetical protein